MIWVCVVSDPELLLLSSFNRLAHQVSYSSPQRVTQLLEVKEYQEEL